MYRQREISLPPTGDPDVVLACSSGLRLPTSPHTKADPFLFEQLGRLFIFVETQTLDDPGRIEFAEIREDTNPDLEILLEEPFHVSYPHVFRIDRDIFMLPETAASGEVRLYKFEQFPHKISYFRTLLSGVYTDPSPILVGNTWYLFMTSNNGLELFYTNDLRTGPLFKHPSSPITTDARYCRSAGVPFYYNGDLVRPAQDCSVNYGGNVNLVRIDTLSTNDYAETPVVNHFLTKNEYWNSSGGHQVNVCPLVVGGYAVAVDGQSSDSIINKISALIWRKLFRRRPVYAQEPTNHS